MTATKNTALHLIRNRKTVSKSVHCQEVMWMRGRCALVRGLLFSTMVLYICNSALDHSSVLLIVGNETAVTAWVHPHEKSAGIGFWSKGVVQW